MIELLLMYAVFQSEVALLPDQPSWPSRRSIDRYSELTAIDIKSFLNPGDCFIDIGPGSDARALSGMLDRGIKLIGVTAHKMESPEGIEMIPAHLPKDIARVDHMYGKARLVTDVYGAFSYGDNPLDILILESLLLAPDGKLACISETKRVGSKEDQKRMSKFAKECLGVELIFEQFETFADANQVMETELRISAWRTGNPRTTDFEELRSAAVDVIGYPEKGQVLFEVEYQSSSGKALGEIWEIHFRR